MSWLSQSHESATQIKYLIRHLGDNTVVPTDRSKITGSNGDFLLL